MKSPIQFFFTLFCFVAILLTSSCSFIEDLQDALSESETDSSTTATPTVTTVPGMDISFDTKTASIGREGGEIKLKDGASLSVPQGTLPENTAVTLERFDNPQNFGKGTVAYEINGLSKATGKVLFTFPASKGLSENEIDVRVYGMQDQRVGSIPYVYDPAAGKVTVTLDPQLTGTSLEPKKRTIGKGQSLGSAIFMALSPLPQTQQAPPWSLTERLRLVFQEKKIYTAQNKELLIKLPYYQQSGGNCWAACAAMMIAGYVPAIERQHYGQVLRAAKAGDEDFGISTSGVNFQHFLTQHIATQTGATVTWRGYWSDEFLHMELLEQLDKGYPVMLEYRWPETHFVLAIGYQNSGQEFIIHDPRGMPVPTPDGGTMYHVYPWSSLKKRLGWAQEVAHILWIEKKPAPENLLSIGCPGANEKGASEIGEAYFYQINPKNLHKVPLAVLQFRPSALSGLRWKALSNSTDTVAIIPSKAEGLFLKFPLWNAGFSEELVDVKIQVRSDADVLFSHKLASPIRLPAAKYNTTNPVNLEAELPTAEFRDLSRATDKGTLEVDIDVMLMQGGSIKDNFTVSAILSVKPEIEKIEPTSASPGDQVTISGFCFGKNKSSKGTVTIGGQSCTIVSWSDNKIVIEVPQDVKSGNNLPVIVTTGEKYEYKSNEVEISISKLGRVTGSFSVLDDRVFGGLDVSGTWELTGNDAAIEDKSERFFSLYVAKGAPARLTINTKAFMRETTFRNDRADGTYDIYTFYTPSLYPLDKDFVFYADGDVDYTLVGSSKTTLTVDFTINSDDAWLSVEVVFAVRYDMKNYNANGELNFSIDDALWGDYNVATFYVDCTKW